MTITINLDLFYKIYDYIKQNPYILIIIWYTIAYFVVRYSVFWTKEEVEKGDHLEIITFFIWVFTPLIVIVACIFGPIYLLGKGLVRIKKD